MEGADLNIIGAGKRVLDVRFELSSLDEGAVAGAEIRKQVARVSLSNQRVTARDGGVQENEVGFAIAADQHALAQYAMLAHRFPRQGNQARDVCHQFGNGISLRGCRH